MQTNHHQFIIITYRDTVPALVWFPHSPLRAFLPRLIIGIQGVINPRPRLSQPGGC